MKSLIVSILLILIVSESISQTTTVKKTDTTCIPTYQAIANIKQVEGFKIMEREFGQFKIRVELQEKQWKVKDSLLIVYKAKDSTSAKTISNYQAGEVTLKEQVKEKTTLADNAISYAKKKGRKSFWKGTLVGAVVVGVASIFLSR